MTTMLSRLSASWFLRVVIREAQSRCMVADVPIGFKDQGCPAGIGLFAAKSLIGFLSRSGRYRLARQSREPHIRHVTVVVSVSNAVVFKTSPSQDPMRRRIHADRRRAKMPLACETSTPVCQRWSFRRFPKIQTTSYKTLTPEAQTISGLLFVCRVLVFSIRYKVQVWGCDDAWSLHPNVGSSLPEDGWKPEDPAESS